MTRRPLRGRDGGGRRGSPSEVVGTSQNTPLESSPEPPSSQESAPEPPSPQESSPELPPEPPSSQCPMEVNLGSLPELPSSQESLPEPPSSQCPMELLEKDPKIVFFEFKEVEGGILRLVVLQVTSKWLLTVSHEYLEAKATYRDGSEARNQYSKFKDILDGKMLIGSDWPKLVDKFKHVGLAPPIPLKIIDTAPFIRSNTKLAQLAQLFGFGKVRNCCLEACLANLDAIMKCRAAMSILDDMEKAVPGYYPIICHIMKFDDESKSKSGIEKEEEKSPLNALAECPSEVLPEGSSSQYPMKDHPGVVLFHFKKDTFGKELYFGAVEVNSKTLKSSNHCGFCIKAIDKGVSRTWEEKQQDPKLKRYRDKYYSDVFDILNGKMLIGYDIGQSDWPMLLEEFKHVGLAPPTALNIIDTALFIRSKTKLAKLAVLFGLSEPVPSIFAPFEYLAAIKECGVAMSILDMEEQDEFHPMISHLMKFKLPEIRKSERLRGIEG